jgi:hypothetical protein
MGADKKSSRRRWKLHQDEHGFQHTAPTHYPSLPSPRSHWSATGPRNQHTTFRPENAAEHQTSSLQTNTGQAGEPHRSDRSLLVKLGNFQQVAPHRSDWWDTPVRPVTAWKPKAPNRPTDHQTDPNSKQQQHRTIANTPRRSPEQKPTKGCTGQTGQEHRS